MRKLCTMNMLSGTAPGIFLRDSRVLRGCYNAECTGTFSKQNKKQKAKPFSIMGGFWGV